MNNNIFMVQSILIKVAYIANYTESSCYNVQSKRPSEVSRFPSTDLFHDVRPARSITKLLRFPRETVCNTNEREREKKKQKKKRRNVHRGRFGRALTRFCDRIVRCFDRSCVTRAIISPPRAISFSRFGCSQNQSEQKKKREREGMKQLSRERERESTYAIKLNRTKVTLEEYDGGEELRITTVCKRLLYDSSCSVEKHACRSNKTEG